MHWHHRTVADYGVRDDGRSRDGLVVDMFLVHNPSAKADGEKCNTDN